MGMKLLVMPIPSEKKMGSTLHQRVGAVVQLHHNTLQLAHASFQIQKNQIDGLIG